MRIKACGFRILKERKNKIDYLNRERIFGKRTVHRINPQTGQDEYYYLDPRGARTFAEMKEIPVPSENSPNPFADEIQNYLYEHDDYNYKQLYGNTPPPAVQTSPSVQQPEAQVQSAEQVPVWQQPTYVAENMYAWKKQNQPTPVIYHNQQNTSSAGQIDYAKWGENIIKQSSSS